MRRYANGLYVVMHVVCGRFGPAEGDAVLRATAVADGRDCRQREEQEPGSAGKKVIAAHVKLLAGYDYRGEPSTGDKMTRAKPFAVQVDAENVRVLEGAWTQEYIDELILFPNGNHDDQLDGSSGAFNELATGPRGNRMVDVIV
jgi:predicted phage terminase large subunit-like protein